MKSRYFQFAGAFLLAIVLMSSPIVAQATPASFDTDNPVTSTFDVVGQWWSSLLVAFGFGPGTTTDTHPQPPIDLAPGGEDTLSSQSLTGSTESELRAEIDPTG